MTPFYESDRAVSEYLLFHYGSQTEILPYEDGPVAALDYPVRCVTRFAGTIQYREGMRALDLGCAVGRSTFELARYCGKVVGIDFSERFIRCADQLRDTGEIPYSYVDHGELTQEGRARVPESIDRTRVRFETGDAMNLRTDLGMFDVVLMANLIDRLVDPAKCLQALASVVLSGGYVVLTSPYTWLEEYTEKGKWIGGKSVGGVACSTDDALCGVMGDSFDLVERADLPFLIREHVRKYQWSVARGTLWRRR